MREHRSEVFQRHRHRQPRDRRPGIDVGQQPLDPRIDQGQVVARVLRRAIKSKVLAGVIDLVSEPSLTVGLLHRATAPSYCNAVEFTRYRASIQCPFSSMSVNVSIASARSNFV